MQETKNDVLGEQLDLLWRIMRGNAEGLAAVRLFRSVLQALVDDAADREMQPILRKLAKAEQALSGAHDDVIRLLELSGHGLSEDKRIQARRAAIMRKLVDESRSRRVAFAEGGSDNDGVVDVSDTLPPPPKPKMGK